MAIGLPGVTGSFIVNASVVGGIITGSSGEFIALPMSSSELMSPNLAAMNDREWSRFYLSDSFGDASGSVIQALNYLSASMDATSGDVTGPGSATDNAIVRFDGTTGKLIQNTAVTTINDDGNIATEGSVSGASTLAGISVALGDNANEFTVSRLGVVAGGAGGDSYSLAANGALSGANSLTVGTSIAATTSISGGTLAIGGDEFTVSVDGLVEGGDAGGTYKLRADGLITGSSAGIFNSLLIQSASVALEVSGGSLNIGGGDFTVSTLGAVAGGAGGDSYSLAANGAISGANSLTVGTSIAATTSISGGTLAIGGDEFTVSQVGAVAGGAGGDSYSLAANGAISGANSLTMGGGIQATTVVSGGTLAIGGDEFTVSVDGLVEGGDGGGTYKLRADGLISGTSAIQGNSLLVTSASFNNGGVQINPSVLANGVVATAFQGQTVTAGNVTSVDGGIKANAGFISGTVGAGIVACNTGSAGGNNYKAALLISSSDIINASNAIPFADQIPRMVMQGTTDAGALADFMISISGGLLQVTQLTYGAALPLV